MRRLLAALAFAAIVATALIVTLRGGDEPGVVPALAVTRMDGDGEYQLSQLADAEAPTLLWFWAPWCTVCNGEAPKIERLAQDGLSVVAIGGRDELANAPAFVERHGLTTPTLLFDETMQVWEHYRIPGQPGAILLDRDGRERQRWLGAFDPQLALDAARAL
ncbi:TlpA family protein disulfide reductase [Solirubrobacter sp. CPCC 204708]|uniref:TlpA family protein disulfide reductase n=1 Tax=Solirubrobacter deserti TaxID=2282478 RepID=A0ABT4RDA9_9ACTN|nr:TlpA disulfide reductase family protein [Solirubrobacter deserti]MBE2317722.1 TlpA family protein disulfide reductase [Solirubrobacter deserti]MDA0136501.1 TlpA family protein disulfide reductase [Solirubrobacter deserti]